MRIVSIAVGVIVLGALAWAQAPTARIQGTLASARGPLPGIEVRAKNTVTNDVVVTTTNPAGEYSVVVVPGTYDVFSTPVGYAAFARRQLAVAAGATVKVDGVLVDNPNAGTPGEIFFLYVRDERQPPSGPAPRTSNGKPDLSGVWLPGPDLEPEAVSLLPWAAALVKERSTKPGDDPRAQCLPSGVVRTNALDLSRFVQTSGLLVMLVEGSVPGLRQVFLDGRGHPKDPSPTWLGHSVGTWDHDTLVVDTVGFNDRGWLDNGGRPQTERLHVTERFRRPDLGHLELEITVDDPSAYAKPWKVRRVLHLAADEEIQEYVCNENNKTDHFVAH